MIYFWYDPNKGWTFTGSDTWYVVYRHALATWTRISTEADLEPEQPEFDLTSQVSGEPFPLPEMAATA